jgi:hypothetical protein
LDFQQTGAWIRRLLNLDTRVFDEVGNNPNATIPGVVIVVVSTLLAGLGGWLWWMLRDFGGNGDILKHSLIIGSFFAIVLWGAWLCIVYVMLTQVFRERAYLEQLLRVMGLASTPLALMLLMFIPGISLAIGLTSLALTFALTGIAIQRVTTADPARVLVSNAAGFFVWAAVLTLLASSNGSSVQPHAPGVFLFNTTTSVADSIFSLNSQLSNLP